MVGPEYAEAFEWDPDDDDSGNTAHLAESRPDRPGISADEAEQVFANGGVFLPNKKEGSGDWKLLGPTDGDRLLTLIVAYHDDRRVLRVFTGWDCTPGERTLYRRTGRGRQ